jgi:hypothetical protein
MDKNIIFLMQNLVEIFSIAIGLIEPWNIKEVIFDKKPLQFRFLFRI